MLIAVLALPLPSPVAHAATRAQLSEIQPGAWLKIDGKLDRPGRFLAERIEHRNPMNELRFSGQVTGPIADGTEFVLLGQPCRLEAGARFRDQAGDEVSRDTVVEGAWVQIRGTRSDDGVFDVRRVELLDRPQLEIQAPVTRLETTPDGLLIHVSGFLVVVGGETRFTGDWSAPGSDEGNGATIAEAKPSRPLHRLRSLAPYRFGGELSLTYENRTNTADVAGDPASGTGNPTFWFAEPEDLIGGGGLWAQWKLRPFRRPSRIEIAYEREQWVDGEILSRDRFTLQLRQQLSGGSRVQFQVDHSPQVYVTHRVDKDAVAGDPRFRPEAYRETEFTFEFRRELARELYGTVFAVYTIREETPWFRERDRKRPGGGIDVELPVGTMFRLQTEYEFRRNTSRNEPDLGRDLSYREHVVKLKVRRDGGRLLGGSRLELSTQWKFRSYSTDDPTDVRRFGRSERISLWRAKILRPLGWLAPYVSWETSGRSIDAPGDVEVLLESDDYGRTLLRAGVEWELGSH